MCLWRHAKGPSGQAGFASECIRPGCAYASYVASRPHVDSGKASDPGARPLLLVLCAQVSVSVDAGNTESHTCCRQFLGVHVHMCAVSASLHMGDVNSMYTASLHMDMYVYARHT